MISLIQKKQDVIQGFLSSVKRTDTPGEFLEFKDDYIDQIFKIQRNQQIKINYKRLDKTIELYIDGNKYEIENVIQDKQFINVHNFEQEISLNNSFQIISGMKKLIFFMYNDQSIFKSQYLQIPTNQVNIFYIFKL